MTGQSLESSVLRRNDADGLEAVEVRRRAVASRSSRDAGARDRRAVAEAVPATDIQTPEAAVLDAERRRTFPTR